MPKNPDSSEPSESIANGHSIHCRYCDQKNSVQAGYVNGEANCGRCKLPLSDAPYKRFTHIDKDDYIHPDDKKALKALRAIPGIDSALKKLIAVSFESAIHVALMAGSIKVTKHQCPDIHAKLEIACATLGVEKPDLFIQQNPVMNAFTYGVEKPYIVLHSALLERLSEDETLAVIAHEVGHIHSEHVLYLTAARLMELLANASIAALLPGSEIVKLIVSMGINSALLAWARRAELSCDRAALLVTQDPHAVGRTMMKLAGGTFASQIDYDLFLEQGREFQKSCDENGLDKFWANVINAGLTHPLPVWRVAEILEWVESGEYELLMEQQ